MRYVLGKLGFYLAALWAAVTLDFLLPRLIPGTPVDAVLARMSQHGSVPPGERKALELMLGGPHGSVVSQYFQYLGDLVRGRFGTSVTYYPVPVSAVIRQSILWTVVLVGVATVFSFTLGIAFGTIAGWKRGTWADNLIAPATFLAAIPYFWLALLALYFLAGRFGLPVAGGYDTQSVYVSFSWPFISSAIGHAILPAATIIISSLAGWALGMRNMMVSTLAEDYMVAAEARGLPRRTLMIGYAARNAVLPSVTGVAIALGFVVGGALITEQVFSYPGIGTALYQAVANSDYPLMQAVFLVITVAVLGGNFLVDLLYAVIDPRTRRRA